MAGSCEACRASITVTQKRIKCTHCLRLYHSECVNYAHDSTISRSQWKCPSCVAGQRKGDNSNTPVRDTLKPAKETLQVNVPKGGVAISLPVSPPVIRETPTTSMDTVGIEATLGSITAGHTTPMSDNTTILSQIENLLDDKLNLLKKDVVKELKGSLMTEIRKELKGMLAKYDQLELSHTKLQNDHESLKTSFETLLKQSSENKNRIDELQGQINKQQQWARMSNLEIVGLPETTNESPIDLVIKIAKFAEVSLQPTHIESAHRVQPMHRGGGRPKPIVVKLQTRMLKDQIIAGLRKSKGISTRDLGLSGPAQRFFVNEHLTPENKQLLSAAKSRAKEKAYKYIWVRNCNIFLRKNEVSPVVTIGSKRDLQKII
ncbi:hypothetical protein ACJJTC_014393 [Scirpophaga incertulas]